MSIYAYTTHRAAQTSMNRSSSTPCKDASTPTTDRSSARPSNGASIPVIPEPKSPSLPCSRVTIQRTDELPEEAALWRAVIAQAIRDIYDSTKHGPRYRREVMAWIASRDFDVVCDNAWVPAYDLREQIAALISLPASLARKYGQLLQRKIAETN